MSIVEIDENELVRLRQLSGVAGRIMANPEGKKLLEKAHKLVDPNAVTPTLDLDAQIEAARAEDRKQIAELRKALETDKEEREKTTRLAQLQETIDKVICRDRQDESREHAPLRQAADAIPVDSTSLSIEEVLDLMERTVKERLAS